MKPIALPGFRVVLDLWRGRWIAVIGVPGGFELIDIRAFLDPIEYSVPVLRRELGELFLAEPIVFATKMRGIESFRISQPFCNQSRSPFGKHPQNIKCDPVKHAPFSGLKLLNDFRNFCRILLPRLQRCVPDGGNQKSIW